ncbi:hypothetical protein EC912_104374 [Luteibacter rhizovicinus]|uniref:Purine-binding chemotaxis protein CheW n=1 Tax=Luteibacter rhizovicinus TaxID=242606 RepID=A0A4R3YPC3_9GAMM|nr:hypothetical protein [Luteibacter rhizovicinus]TCV94176.1 hypothetical protein EC912_104374 [Luteibacter rhizovicinus]
MTTSMQAADQLVADYLAELLTPAAIVPAAVVQVMAFEPGRKSSGTELVVEGDTRYLLCIAAGVRLAIPMRDVIHLLPMPPLAPTVATRPICLGRWRHPSGEARVADLAAVMSPDMAGSPATTLVLLSDRQWALACTVEDEPVVFGPDAIQWRTNATTRPWLAGMAKEPKCGVVDTAALIEWLEREECP